MEDKAAKVVQAIVEFVGTNTEGAWADKKARILAAASQDDEAAFQEFISWFDDEG